MEKYATALKKNGEAILDSYRTVIANLQSLRGLSEPRRKAFTNINVDRLTLCYQPHLVFVGFDAPQKNDWRNSPHLAKLLNAFGAQFVHMEKILLFNGKC